MKPSTHLYNKIKHSIYIIQILIEIHAKNEIIISDTKKKIVNHVH